MRLIDADALMKALVRKEPFSNNARVVIAECMEEVRHSPSVNPQEPKTEWIPVSERMPEEREWIGTKRFGTTISDEVYVTMETPSGHRFCEHIRFQNGNLSMAKQAEMDALFKGAKPIAWQPLPKPYEPQERSKE